jgi:thiamine pyrophosphokinase
VPAAIIFAAASLKPTPRLTARLAVLDRPFVIAADGGATTALAFGLRPDVVIGDLDSLAASTLSRLDAAHVPIETHPRDKDATDGQLALERALQSQPSELFLLGFLGGPRLDQALANVILLTRLQIPAVLLDETNECVIVRPAARHTWFPEAGEVISLLPMSAEVVGVTTHGLRWRLDRERLTLGTTRGLSNEPVDNEVSVSIESGLLLVTRHFPTA